MIWASTFDFSASIFMIILTKILKSFILQADLCQLWVRLCPISKCCVRQRRMTYTSTPSCDGRMYNQVYMDNERRSSTGSATVRFEPSKKYSTCAARMNGDTLKNDIAASVSLLRKNSDFKRHDYV